MKLVAVALILAAATAQARPFRLMTTEAAENPRAHVTVGLQEAGGNLGPVFIDTNPLYDVALVENVGAKYVFTRDTWGLTAGARYLWFVGSNVLEGQVKSRESRISRFTLDSNGALAYAGASYHFSRADGHVNFQFADVKGSRVTSVVAATNVPVSQMWDAIGEIGYDFANHQTRASLGFTRTGPTFGTRLGVTYVKIDDPYLQYTGVLPIIDLFWLIGGS